MTERDKLISKLKILIRINKMKQEQYQEKIGNSECGCLTREGLEMARLFPQMQSLGITMEDLA